MTRQEHDAQAERCQRWERLNNSLTHLNRMIAKLDEPAKRGIYRSTICVEGDNWGSSQLDAALLTQLRSEARMVQQEMDAV